MLYGNTTIFATTVKPSKKKPKNPIKNSTAPPPPKGYIYILQTQPKVYKSVDVYFVDRNH